MAEAYLGLADSDRISECTGYIPLIVTLEFGGRATGEPHSVVQVKCDIAEYLPELEFPMASPWLPVESWEDYQAMVTDQVLLANPLGFDALMAECLTVETRVNAATKRR